MAGYYTKKQASMARNADLAAFLLRTDPQHFRQEGNSIRLLNLSRPRSRQGTSIVIPKGKNWWKDFATGESGNPVDLLTKKLGYSVPDAILALCGDSTVPYRHAADPVSEKSAAPESDRILTFPDPTSYYPRKMYEYLTGRGIPAETIRDLQRLGLLYQAKAHSNLVFVSAAKDFAEIRGSGKETPAFHQTMKTRADRFWHFSIGHPKKAYICEGAIDAVSLYLLLKKQNLHDQAAYVSIAGVCNQQAIDRIKSCIPVIMAVDNDEAGRLGRERNPDCGALIPIHKDWNEDLQTGIGSLGDRIHQAGEKQAEYESVMKRMESQSTNQKSKPETDQEQVDHFSRVVSDST